VLYRSAAVILGLCSRCGPCIVHQLYSQQRILRKVVRGVKEGRILTFCTILLEFTRSSDLQGSLQNLLLSCYRLTGIRYRQIHLNFVLHEVSFRIPHS
jgi:hypothetical protein